MKEKIIDRKLIESIAKNDNTEFFERVNNGVNNVLSNAINDMSQQIAYISLNNVVLQPVNEILTGGFTDNSKFVYFLGIDNAQLELNTLKSTTFWKDLKERIVWAWQNRSERKRRRALKKKKKQELEGNDSMSYDFDPSHYNIYSIVEDLQTATAKFLTESSIVFLEGDHIKIVGKDDFGPNTQILIYPVIYNGDVYKYYAGRKKGYINIDIDSRIDLIDEKVEKAGKNFISLIKIFNVLYFFANKAMPNQVFIESVLYSCPNELFAGNDIYKVFVKIINYLTMTPLKDIRSLLNMDKTIFKDELTMQSAYGFERFMNQLVYLNENKNSNKAQNNKAKKGVVPESKSEWLERTSKEQTEKEQKDELKKD